MISGGWNTFLVPVTALPALRSPSALGSSESKCVLEAQGVLPAPRGSLESGISKAEEVVRPPGEKKDATNVAFCLAKQKMEHPRCFFRPEANSIEARDVRAHADYI